jgi:hypothetical protein
MTLPKFSFYDQFGYILVGFYQIFSLWLLSSLIAWPIAKNLIDLSKPDYAIPFILIAYFTGHLVQAISNFFEKRESKIKKDLQKGSQEMLEKARDFFGLKKNSSHHIIWNYCYTYTLSNDFSGQIQLFNSMHSLYRGIWAASILSATISILISLFYMAAYIHQAILGNYVFCHWSLVIYGGFFVLLTLIFHQRRKRFLKYMNEKVLITFDILSKDLLKK